MKKKTVLETEDISLIADNTFIFSKETGKGFIKRNFTDLDIEDKSFSSVVAELEGRSEQDLIDLGMDPHDFVEGQPIMSQRIAKRVLKEVESLEGSEREDALRAKLQNNRMFGFEKIIPVYVEWARRTEEGKIQFFTSVNLRGRKVQVQNENGDWSDYLTPTEIKSFNRIIHRVTLPTGSVTGMIVRAKVNFFDGAITGEVKNKKLQTPMIVVSNNNAFTGDEITISLTTPEVNYKSVEWQIFGPHTVVDGQKVGSKDKSITIKCMSAGPIAIMARLIGGDTIDYIHYIASDPSSSANISVQEPIQLPQPNFNVASLNVETNEVFELQAVWSTPPYGAEYEWEINGNYAGTLTNSQIQSISITTEGQIQVRVRLVKDLIGFVDSVWSPMKIITATEPASGTGPMQFTDAGNTEPPSFIDGKEFENINPGVDTTDNISKYK